MTRKKNMTDFVSGGCEAVGDHGKFVKMWLQTEGHPCSVCGVDRSKCPFYRKLQEEGNP